MLSVYASHGMGHLDIAVGFCSCFRAAVRLCCFSLSVPNLRCIILSIPRCYVQSGGKDTGHLSSCLWSTYKRLLDKGMLLERLWVPVIIFVCIQISVCQQVYSKREILISGHNVHVEPVLHSEHLILGPQTAVQ